jgi:A/G-specific adenine glycosylase
MSPTQFQQAVLNWFDLHGRTNLPWQTSISPYSVWVSEIMLQQTQVNTVIPYFERFMQSFPKVEALAAATEDQVLHHWTGLGYYARARNLHKTAQRICHQLNGQFPDTVEQLAELPGIGRSTAGAICSIAFKKPAAILDGNVKRVLARYAAIEGWPGQTAVHNRLWQQAETYSPQQRVADYTQAMMDLGATLCTRSSPSCERCPLSGNCIAYSQGKQTEYPGKKPKKKLPVRTTCFLLIYNQQGELLLQKNPPAGLWGGLWLLPQVDAVDETEDYCAKIGLELTEQQVQPAKRHTFSHFHLDYQPILVQAADRSCAVAEGDNQLWYNPQNPLSLGMPAPIVALIHPK